MSICRIDGFPVIDGPAEWTLRPGVQPATSDFTVDRSTLDALSQGTLRPVTLTFGSPDAKGVEIRNLYVIEERPAADPHTAVVRLADRRWFWPHDHIRRYFNMRRHVGVRRVKAGFERPELDPLDPEIRYAPHSLNNGSPWSATDALEDVFESVKQSEQSVAGVAAALVVDADFPGAGPLPLENVELDDNGASAIKRLLASIPGAQITVTADGVVRVYSTVSGNESRVFASMGAEQEGGGHVQFLTNARIRPREVHVLFTPEVELRLDFEEVEVGQTVARNADDPFVENVLPIPDYSLSVNGKELAQGTWITISEALTAWGAVPNFGSLDYSILRKGMVPYMDLWTGLRLSGISDGDADWGARIAALQQHFRRTFRMNQRVLDRVLSINAYRTATINPVTGSRAPATAFQNWAVVATQRFLAVQNAAGAESYAYATNFEGYPSGGSLDSSARAAPARVSIVDKDQGIIRLDFLVDENRVHEQILPSEISNIPTGDIRGGHLAWNARRTGGLVPELSSTHKMITVLSVIPASPNNDGVLFRLRRKPSDVRNLLPGGLSPGLEDARGPVMEVRVGAGWETARFAWADDDATRIRGALGIGVDERSATVNTISDLCTNLGEGGSAASLDAIANAVAASVYAGFADRNEGNKTAPVTSDAAVEGFIDAVIHRALPTGEVTSTARASQAPASIDFMAHVPTSVRQLLLKLAEPGR